MINVVNKERIFFFNVTLSQVSRHVIGRKVSAHTYMILAHLHSNAVVAMTTPVLCPQITAAVVQQYLVSYRISTIEYFWNDSVENNRVIAIATTRDSIKNLAPVFQPIRCKTKFKSTSCAPFLAVIVRNSAWFIALFAPVVIGWSNEFGIGFSIVIWKPL